MTRPKVWWWEIAMPASSRRRRRTSTPNPHKGQIKDGSSTDKVLAVLVEALPNSMSRSQIVDAADCPAKSVDWALYYLRSIGRVACWSKLDKRSALYLEYKAVQGGK